MNKCTSYACIKSWMTNIESPKAIYQLEGDIQKWKYSERHGTELDVKE